jgi:3-oxo-5-alpha-steroid 4-dehydrogenase 3
MSHKFSPLDLLPSGPSVRTFISLPIFIFASGLQHDVHAYLASLGTSKSKAGVAKQDSKQSHYQLPTHAAFGLSLTPHYLAECLIYLSLALLAAPAGSLLNWTLFCAFVFAAVNLGITADGTRNWYRMRFGTDVIGDKARMVPGIW